MMSVLYCHRCGAEEGFLRQASTGGFLQSSYQLQKFMKHTIPSTGYDVASVFNDPSTQTYANYIVNTFASGCVEIDDRNRRNIIWVAGKTVGMKFEKGDPVLPEDAVKLVLSTDPQRVHAYPVSSTTLSTGFCSKCDGAIST